MALMPEVSDVIRTCVLARALCIDILSNTGSWQLARGPSAWVHILILHFMECDGMCASQLIARLLTFLKLAQMVFLRTGCCIVPSHRRALPANHTPDVLEMLVSDAQIGARDPRDSLNNLTSRAGDAPNDSFSRMDCPRDSRDSLNL